MKTTDQQTKLTLLVFSFLIIIVIVIDNIWIYRITATLLAIVIIWILSLFKKK
jgi:uncharacterized membrane protein